jgi:hypothetical protein
MRFFCSLLSYRKTVLCDEKTARSSSCAAQRPPSYYTCLSEVFSRKQQGEWGRKRREKKRKSGGRGRGEMISGSHGTVVATQCVEWFALAR